MNDKQEMRITDEEIKLIQITFKDNTPLLKLLRKIFLPEYDPNAPIGQTVDLWTIKDIASMTPEECKIYFQTRRDLILHIESQLMQLKVLAEMESETVAKALERAKKDSVK